MRYTYSILCFLMLHCATALAQTTYPNGLTGCIARWNFTNPGTFSSLPDVSGNGNNGTVTNITTSAGWRGASNAAGKFNGISSEATVLGNAMLSPTSITIIAVVKMDGFYSGTYQENNIIYKGTGYYQNSCWGLKVGDQDGNGSNLDPTTERLDFAGPAALTSSTGTGPVIALNDWYFLATTFSGSVAKLYTVKMDAANHVNNVIPNSISAYTTALTSNTSNVRIGTTNLSTFPYWFNGSMDEVALFNRVLSDSEIQATYDYLWAGAFINQPFVDTVKYPGAAMNVNYTVPSSYAFNTGNIFTIQLSDAVGSFSSPVSIGSITSTSSGTVACTIPASTISGTGYRIRVVSTNPTFTSLDNGKNIKILSVGIGGIKTESHFSLYPNPARGSFTINGATTDNEPVSVEVNNAIGQIVYRDVFTPANNKINTTINIPDCANGVYSVHLKNTSINATYRLVINK